MLQSAPSSGPATVKCYDRSPSFPYSAFSDPQIQSRTPGNRKSVRNSAGHGSVSAPHRRSSAWRSSAKTCRLSFYRDSTTCDDRLSTKEICIDCGGCPLQKILNENRKKTEFVLKIKQY